MGKTKSLSGKRRISLKRRMMGKMQSWVAVNHKPISGHQKSLMETIEDAKQQWIYAQQNLEQMLDPLLIEQGIYQLEAAEQRYNYLLQQAKGDQLRNNVVQLH